MVPDHTFLLDEGEVFVALDDQILSMKEIVAMRVRVHFISINILLED
jgi:hypothetical protein